MKIISALFYDVGKFGYKRSWMKLELSSQLCVNWSLSPFLIFCSNISQYTRVSHVIDLNQSLWFLPGMVQFFNTVLNFSARCRMCDMQPLHHLMFATIITQTTFWPSQLNFPSSEGFWSHAHRGSRRENLLYPSSSSSPSCSPFGCQRPWLMVCFN